MAKKDGLLIQIRFSDDLIGDINETDDATHFSIDFYVPDFAPVGDLFLNHRIPYRVTKSGDDSIILHFNQGNVNSFQNAVGDITIHYDGAGSIRGEGGYVSAFNYTFTPSDLEPKYNQHLNENISLSISVSQLLFSVSLGNGYEYESINLYIFATGVLTKVEDL